MEWTGRYEAVATIAAFGGWTSCVADVLGVELSRSDVVLASDRIGPHGWRVGRHAPSTGDDRGDLAEGRVAAVSRARMRVDTLARVIRSGAQARAWWDGMIPRSHAGVEGWLRGHWGFVPCYMRALRGLEAKRAVCVMAWAHLLRPDGKEENCEWSLNDRAVMYFVYAKMSSNALLTHHALHLAIRCSVSPSLLLSASSGHPTCDERLDAALAVVRSSASLRRIHRATNNRALIRLCRSPAGVVELATTLGLFNFLHRLAAMMGSVGDVKLEPEVAESTRAYGSFLGLDKGGNTVQGKSAK
ncbi:hypothetical protein HK101_001158 [Irineochytrium annulatum]|nr:hypothetical protein HK101_001158 [Irineochytrium annulatum]